METNVKDNVVKVRGMVVNDIQLRQLQMKELEMLLEVDRLCKKHQLTYYLIGGSALGAIRHGGFIPWDDDIDIALPRHDYQRFLEVSLKELADAYYLQTYRRQPHFPFPYAKVNSNNTTFIETGLQKLKIHHGIFIDVFPLDGVPNRLLMQRVQEFFFKVARRIPIGLSQRLTFLRCLAMDWVISRVSLDHADNWANRVGGRREIMDRAIFGTPRYLEFEGHQLPVPNQCEKYLTNIYGQYLEVPPVDQRNGHNPWVVDLNKSYMDYLG